MAARGPHFPLTCIIFQALCKIDIQEVGRTDYSAVLGGVNSRRAERDNTGGTVLDSGSLSVSMHMVDTRGLAMDHL